MMEPRKSPLQAHLAEHLFLAEHGPSGLKWDDLSDDRHEDYMKTAGRVLEGFYAGPGRVVVVDSMNDQFWLAASPTPEATEPTWIKCATCDDWAVVTCLTCGGSGCTADCLGGHPDDGQKHDLCPICNNAGVVPCPDCSTEGDA